MGKSHNGEPIMAFSLVIFASPPDPLSAFLLLSRSRTLCGKGERGCEGGDR
jgi:hypothetical protein